ncbi:o-succinylbenzoate synthase [Salinactinospora qingdaonensis]|uniref:O-succinylbenzoate synthase n=2 Tax=Salinactinospora qingdaonensis TaxID=702744 RepID=A0ABP7FBK7_9ACTN
MIRLRRRHPAPRDSGGGQPKHTDHIVVRAADETGRVGWGEIVAATPQRWRAVTEEIAPALLKHPWQRPTEAAEVWSGLAPDPAVVAGVDTACWDLWSRRRDTPLSHALGGTRTAVTAAVTVGRQPSLESLVREVNRQVGNGVRCVRLEIEPGWDIDVVRAVRQTYPFLVLEVSARQSYSEDPAHLEVLRALDDYGLLAIEEPLPVKDLAGYARLRRELRTPVALGPSIDSLEHLDAAIRAEAADAVALHVAHLGGLTPARRAHDRAVDAGWQVWCGDDGHSGLGRAAAVALASLPGMSLPSEMPGAGAGFARDIVSPPVRAHDGITPIPLTEAGLGYTVEESTIEALTQESVTLRR